MVDKNGAGATTLGGLSSSVAGSLAYYRPQVDTVDGYISPTITPNIFTRQDSYDGSSATVQLQVSTVNTFVSTVHDSDLVQADNVTGGRQVTGLADGGLYYMRARTKKTIGAYNYISPWTATRSFTVLTKSGISSMNITMNIGVEHTPEDVSPAYAYENVGVEPSPAQTWPQYAYENVGVEVIVVDNVPQYVYEGDVNTATPNPMIWFLLPSYGREGDGIAIYGFGFGDLQSTYTGVVEVDWGGVTGWQSVPIVSWQTFPADAPAYTAARVIDEVAGIVDPQHTVIQILVPAGAIPPGYPVRVRTDGA
jgi:hypothetical protein